MSNLEQIYAVDVVLSANLPKVLLVPLAQTQTIQSLTRMKASSNPCGTLSPTTLLTKPGTTGAEDKTTPKDETSKAKPAEEEEGKKKADSGSA